MKIKITHFDDECLNPDPIKEKNACQQLKKRQ